MRFCTTVSLLALAGLPAVAGAQDAKKVTCADHTIVASSSACADHGGVQKPGGLRRAGREVNKAAIDVKDEAKRTPNNVAKGAKTAAHDVDETAEHAGHAVSKTAKKARHGAGEVAGDVSETAQKAVAPTQYYATCKDGTKWTGRTRRGACKHKGGVADWTDSTGARMP